MKYFLIIFFLLFTFGCGDERIQFECSHKYNIDGISVCSIKPIKIKQVIATIEWTSSYAKYYYPQVGNLLEDLKKKEAKLYFTKGDVYLAKNCKETEFDDLHECELVIGGQNRNHGTTIISKYHECLGGTALVHELLHSIEIFYIKDIAGDRNDHMTPYFFYDWGKLHNKVPETVEHMGVYTQVYRFPECERFRSDEK